MALLNVTRVAAGAWHGRDTRARLLPPTSGSCLPPSAWQGGKKKRMMERMQIQGCLRGLGGEIYEAESRRSFQEGGKKKKKGNPPSGGCRSVLLVVAEISSCQCTQRRVSSLRDVVGTLGRCLWLLQVAWCHVPGTGMGTSWGDAPTGTAFLPGTLCVLLPRVHRAASHPKSSRTGAEGAH